MHELLKIASHARRKNRGPAKGPKRRRRMTDQRPLLLCFRNFLNHLARRAGLVYAERLFRQEVAAGSISPRPASHADVTELAAAALPFQVVVVAQLVENDRNWSRCRQNSVSADRRPAREDSRTGKTSPSCERKQTPVPARQPLVIAFMSLGWPPGCPVCPTGGPPPGFNEIPVEPGIVISVGPMCPGG